MVILTDKQSISSQTGTGLISRAFLTAILLISLTACENISTEVTHNASANWNDETQTLTISGNNNFINETVVIHDADDGSLLGEAIVVEGGSWSASVTSPACAVHVELPNGTTTLKVKDAPKNCTVKASSFGSRAISRDNIPVNVNVVDNPVALNTVPNSIIISPPQDMVINVGESINFEGVATGTNVTPPFSYNWNFSGAAPNSTIQNPGLVVFNQPGTYFIQLTATDNLGIADTTPAVRTITVNNTASPISNIPVPQITSPASVNGVVSINVGETLFFSGFASDSSGGSAFTFEWDFSSVYPAQFGSTPGAIPFNRAGTYIVRLYAINSQGIRSTTPATITVNVGNSNGANQAPNGFITQPVNDIVINTGDTVVFQATAIDPENHSPFYYSWDFQGAATNINMSPNNVTQPVVFNRSGIYTISMSVTDALGATDPNPVLRVVTVLNSASNPPGTGLSSQISSPPDNITIVPGQSVFFSAMVPPGTANTPLQYFWDFDGGATNSNLLTPGNITFRQPGQYFVVFYALDALGNILPSPDLKTITVADPSGISVRVTSPDNNSVLPVEQSVPLNATISNTTGNTNLNYQWKITDQLTNQLVFNSRLYDPGNFIFSNPGSYLVSLSVNALDPFGNETIASTASSRLSIIDALPTFPNPTPGPIGGNGRAILSPASNMIVPSGSRVNFVARNVQGTNVSYRWDFANIAPASIERNPPAVIFNTLGAHLISLRISGIDNGVPFDLFEQRQITVTNTINPPGQGNNPGTNGIVRPTTDLVVNLGTSIAFEGNSALGSNLLYNWNFGNVVAPSTARVPPPVQFNTPGSHLVTLQILGSNNGIPVNEFDQRTITVLQADGSNPPLTVPNPGQTPSTLPEGYIIEPATPSVDIRAGESVLFAGRGFDPLGSGPLTFQWGFGGAINNINSQNPGYIAFNQPGSFVVTLLVKNALDQYDPTPATIVVNVAP